MGIGIVIFTVIMIFILTCLFNLLIFLFEQLFPKLVSFTDKLKSYLKGGVL
jgi:hypothetical protein